MARQLYQSQFQHAEGNLSYLQFVALVDRLWTDSHPGIPLFASMGNQDGVYPAIIYSLQVRRPHPNEPKPRFRERIRTAPGEEDIIISAQRFQNIINFSAVAEVGGGYARWGWESGVEAVEQLIEHFEDFMLEMTPVFKEMGVSEFVYARRQPDDEESRQGDDVVTRTVSYMVTTEKIRQTTARKLEQAVVRARMHLVEKPYFTGSADSGRIVAYGISFEEGDWVLLAEKPEADAPFPGGLSAGMPYHVNSVTGTDRREYVLAEVINGTPVAIVTDGVGYIGRTDLRPGENVDVDLEDQWGAGGPWLPAPQPG